MHETVSRLERLSTLGTPANVVSSTEWERFSCVVCRDATANT
jgi:hypothetical protein